ncbi:MULTISPECIES: carboxymuconolactone decarboxylase family protein [unclassified Rhodococcus (in: high G+C Gram-positive bacteria)]|uniref:carboxymuconolactone decarboxylase family protein n=1 Tax=unclassified Rhodococcus (in: high G+C Gram-positive bacteria) TaxID=192944 RepID=UPI0029551098|nr:carboxymuconolactone decarboxylase family protein [Rhodococcus sp. IEGM 1343]MDV8056814.1 carboxymuconolactone decarboxylase family protein [Rhodococcus sp. IEGM 1343]
MAVTTPRIPSGTARTLGPINWVICKVIAKGAGVPNPHLFTTLGRTGGLYRAWLFYSGHLMPGGKISRKETEMVILRVAHLRDSAYEMDHHIRLGKRAGIDRDLLELIKTGPDAPGLSTRYRTILAAVDELIATKILSDATWNQLATQFDERRLIEFVLLVTQYDGLATTLGVLRVERDYGDRPPRP